MAIKNIRKNILMSLVAILIITALEFPPPIGFETRPQDNVSLHWLWLFLTIVIVELATAPLIYRKPKLGAVFGIIAAALNILQVLADQLHLMQPEVAPLGYTALEGMVVLSSLLLAYFSYQLMRSS